MDDKNIDKMNVASGIWALIEDEGEANKGYAEFLACYGYKLGPNMIRDIREIMSEEIKHIDMLQRMAEELTGIKMEIH